MRETGRASAIAARVGWMAVQTVREALRQRLLGLGAVAAVVVAFGLRWVQQLDFGGTGSRLAVDFAYAGLSLAGSVLAAVLVVQQVFEERETGGQAMLLAKPVRHWEYLMGKWLGVGTLLLGFCGFAGLGLSGLVAFMDHAPPAVFVPGPAVEPIPLLTWVTVALLLWLKLLIVAAVSLLIACWARTLALALLATLLVLAAGHLQATATAVYSAGGGSGRLVWVVLQLIPNLQLYDLADRLGRAPGLWMGDFLPRVIVYAAVYASACLGAGSWLLRHRDA